MKIMAFLGKEIGFKAGRPFVIIFAKASLSCEFTR